MIVVAGGWQSIAGGAKLAEAAAPIVKGTTNTHALGEIVYTHYVYLFQAAGLILLVAMIGAIVLTHRRRTGVKRQRIADQNARGTDTVEVRKVEVGKGI